VNIGDKAKRAEVLDTDGELTCTSDIIKVFNFVYAEQSFDFVDGSLVLAAEHSIDVCYHSLCVRRAVCRHMLTDWLEVLPEIVDGLNHC